MDDEEEVAGTAGWLISYADLMTLLFAAFVVLYGTIQEGKSNRVLGATAAIREAFREISENIEVDQMTNEIKKGQFMFKSFRGDTLNSPGPKQYLIKDDQKIAIDHDKNLVENLINSMVTANQTYNTKLKQSMITEPHEMGFTIKLIGAQFFAPNDYHLTSQGRKNLKKLALLLQKINRSLLIEGHTDNTKSTNFSHQELGALRAGAIASLLQKEGGFPAYMLDTISYGASRPVGNNHKPAERDRNRRVEIKVMYR